MSQVLSGESTSHAYCTWDGMIGQITSGDIKFTTNEKFSLGFSYDALYYEPAVGNDFKIWQGGSVQLTTAEINMIEAYCNSYADKQDYPVWCYDSNNLYIGEMLKSEAITKKMEYTLIGAPDHPASKLVGNQWVKVKLVIKSDGSIILDPAQFCSACLLGFTEAEYNAMEKPKNINYKWNFVTSAWYDPRTLDACITSAITELKNKFDFILAKELKDFTPFRQMDTWVWQVREATAYLDAIKTGGTADTPYLSAFLAARTDQNKPSLQELCEDVLHNHQTYLTTSAAIYGELWGYQKQIQDQTTNDDIDTLMATFNTTLMKRMTA